MFVYDKITMNNP